MGVVLCQSAIVFCGSNTRKIRNAIWDLTSSSKSRREHAIQLLGSLEHDTSAYLVKHWKDISPRSRRELLRHGSAVPLPESPAFRLGVALKDPDREVRQLMLQHLPAADKLPQKYRLYLLRQAASNFETERSRALEIIHTLGEPVFIGTIFECVEEGKIEVLPDHQIRMNIHIRNRELVGYDEWVTAPTIINTPSGPIIIHHRYRLPIVQSFELKTTLSLAQSRVTSLLRTLTGEDHGHTINDWQQWWSQQRQRKGSDVQKRTGRDGSRRQ
ncbi:MAG: hypothetical protein D6820_12535 [Lentisphaerae bacterium]|nr:MAG: hypothetical protein D6820_12535 [Lentisphaerota bacterium]